MLSDVKQKPISGGGTVTWIGTYDKVRVSSSQEAVWTTREDEEERPWDELFASSQDLLAEMANKARADRRAGRTRPLDPDKL
jgi:hypothetical protein